MVYFRVAYPWLMLLFYLVVPSARAQTAPNVLVDQFQLIKTEKNIADTFSSLLRDRLNTRQGILAVTFKDSSDFFREHAIPLSEPCADIQCTAHRADKLLAAQAVHGRIEHIEGAYRVLAVLVDVQEVRTEREMELEFPGQLNETSAEKLTAALFPDSKIKTPSGVPQPIPSGAAAFEIKRDKRKERRNFLIGMAGGGLVSALGIALILQIKNDTDTPKTTEFTVEW